MKLSKILLGISVVLLIMTACTTSVIANFEVANHTAFDIDSLKIEPNISEIGKFISLKKNKKAAYKSDMTTIAKTDGAYQISFLINGKKKTQIFGYFSNGYPSEIITKIEIEKDTILINQVFEE